MLTRMDRDSEDQLMLRLTVEHLLATGQWPVLRDLHRCIHKDLHEEIDVRAAASRLAPRSHGGYHDLGDKFAPSLRTLGRIEEGTALLDAMLAFIRHARAKYLSSDGETQVTEPELVEELDLDAATSRAVRELIDGVPFLTHGGGSGPDGWYFNVSDDITRWRGVETRQDLLDTLEQMEEQQKLDYAAIADAKHRMIEATRRRPTVLPLQREDASLRWYETPVAKGLAWAAGVLGTVIAVVSWLT